MSREADVLVVGAGIAGLLIATRLSRSGKRVILLESGGEHQTGESHPLNEVEHRRSIYAGATTGRARCLGGTSTLWGGAMIPYQAADILDAGWPLSPQDILPYQKEVEELFRLPKGPYEVSALTDRHDGRPGSHVARLAKWPPFSRRNVASLLNKELRGSSGPEVWLNATATQFAFAPNGRLDSLTATAPNGRQLIVRAPETVLASGAIESTRLLLLANMQAEDHIFAPDSVLGRYFSDHISVRVGQLSLIDRRATNRVIGFRFEGEGMRNLRFEPSPEPKVRAVIPPGFAHFGLTSEKEDGFDALRALFRNLQRRRRPDPATLLTLARSAPWLSQALWWRIAEKRLLFPPKAIPQLHMVIEQEPCAANRITLSRTRLDAHGQPVAAIDWSVSEQDTAALVRSTGVFLDQWHAAPLLSKLGVIERRSLDEVSAEMTLGGGIFHPSGSTRMGTGPQDGIVSAHLRCFRIPNLSIAATSVFPTGGGSNPTMTLMQASLRLADSLASQ